MSEEVALSDDDDDAGWDLGPAEGNIAGVPVSATGAQKGFQGLGSRV